MPRRATDSPLPSARPRKGLRGRTLRAFSYHDFRVIWIGALTSTVGTWTQQTAQAWVVYQLTGSAFYLGLVAFLGELPFILFTLVGGAVADRIDRRHQLLASQYIQMTNAFILTGLLALDVIQVWHFAMIAFVTGTAQAFGGPAYQALIPTLVEREDMPNAIALNSIQFNLARMTGPVLAGLLLDRVGAVFCFAFNGLSFVAVIASLYLIKTSFTPAKPKASVLRDIKDGLRYLFERRALWQLSLLGFITSFCAVPLLTQLPVFASVVFGANARLYSYLMAASGAGSVTGALFYAHFSQMRRRGLATLRVQLIFATLLGLFALNTSLPWAFVLLFAGGFNMMILIASINSLMQLTVSDEMRGRVLSVFMLSFRGGTPLGNLTTGTVADLVTPASALLINSLVLASAGLAFLFKSRIRRL